SHVDEHRLGIVLCAPLDVILTEEVVVQPDIVFLDKKRIGRLRRRGIVGAPTLVVEILSPRRVSHDRERKRRQYARHGVRYYWIVDPERKTLEAKMLAVERYEPVGLFIEPDRPVLPPFPELTIELHTIWPPDLPV